MISPIPKPKKAEKAPKPLKQRTPLVAKTHLKATKRLRVYGKAALKWKETRALWLAQNPPNDSGEYVCGICKRTVHKTELTLDHVIPRSRAPHLRYKLENLQPAHLLCNTAKGSKVVD